jgi:hypothetical protein
MKSAFRSELARQMRLTSRNLAESGITSMSVGNFRQMVKSPSASLEGSPKGTNARWLYSEMFKELCNGKADHEMIEMHSQNKLAKLSK